MGERDEVIERLRQVRTFSGCEDDVLASVGELMQELSVDAGVVLTRQGDEGREFIVIAEGHATVERDGEEIAGVFDGSFVGELALLDNSYRTATVTAVTPVRAFVLGADEFRALLDRSTALREIVERTAADRRPR